MGLLSRAGDREGNALPSGDDVLLFQAMLLMAGADGVIDEEELLALETYFLTLPEFRGKSFRDVSDAALKRIADYAEPHLAVELLSGLSSVRLKRKCFLLAADIALSSGGVVESEDRLLESMREVLDITREEASRILEVLAIKYATD